MTLSVPTVFPTAVEGWDYISGPMRKRPFTNFPAFDSTKKFLLAQGRHVHSPADNDRKVWPGIEQVEGFAEGAHVGDGPPGFTFPELLVWDVYAIGHAERVVFLPDWNQSIGALVERHIAEAFERRFAYAIFEGGECVDVIEAIA